jgi:hypothetical protein
MRTHLIRTHNALSAEEIYARQKTSLTGIAALDPGKRIGYDRIIHRAPKRCTFVKRRLSLVLAARMGVDAFDITT